MSLRVSDAIRSALQNRIKKPQLILEIDGLPVLASGLVQRAPLYGDDIYYGDDGLYYGGLIGDENILPYIDLARSTNQITQQLNIDKGGSNSATSFDVCVVDKGGLLTEYITPGKRITEILSRKAKVYLCLEGASHPQDSILFFSGIVAGAPAGAGFVKFNLVSSEKLKNLELFPKLSCVLTAPATDSDVVLTVDDTENFVLPADGTTLKTYLLINDEIIEYTGKTATTFTGCVRGCFDTIASAHSVDDNAESAYRLQGNVRDLALKLMLSAGPEYYLEDIPIIATNTFGAVTVANSIFFSRWNMDDRDGVTAGDSIVLDSGANAGTHEINSVVPTNNGTYIIVNSTLVDEGVGPNASFICKYNVLPPLAGLQMLPEQVDIQEFETKYQQFSAAFFDYDFFIKDAIKGGEFINEQILFPSGCYALPRKAKTSIGLTIPPLAQSETLIVDWSNVTNAKDIVIERNISNNFYNAVIYKYDLDQVVDKYKRGKIRTSTDSTDRIRVGNKPLTIAADGVRFESNFTTKFDIQARRFLDRYQYAAESLYVDVNLEAGFRAEIGDSVVLRGAELQISDTSGGTGTRSFKPRLFEIQNKTFNLTGKPIRLYLVDTAFSLNGRYGVVSPASKIDAGSTASRLKVKASFGTLIRTATEGAKWRGLSGMTVKVHDKAHTYSEETELIGVDPVDEYALLVSPALSVPPSENDIVEVCNYSSSTDPETDALQKAMFVFINKQFEVVSGASTTVFDVDAPTAALLRVGYIVKLHDLVYTYESAERVITDITGTTITVDNSLGLTPSLGDKIELLGFVDGGKPYRIL